MSNQSLLKSYIELVKTGSPREVKEAKKAVERFCTRVGYSDHNLFMVFVEEIRNFNQIKDIDHQSHFINILKWPFWTIGLENFEEWSDFVLENIQHPSGKIRQAVLNSVDYLLMDLSFEHFVIAGHKMTKRDKDLYEKSLNHFGQFVDKTKVLINKYNETKFNRYKYLSSLPVGVYKSLQKLLGEHLLRADYYEDLYKKYLKNNNVENVEKKGHILKIKSEIPEINPLSVFQFKISLNDSAPKVWRRILVPNYYSFFDLHCAIQNAMGWTDSHLHAFYISQKTTSQPIAIKFPDPENDGFWGDSEYIDERKEKIVDYFGKQIKQCQYTYDFGDSWDHTITFEKEFPQNHELKYPVCSGGANACPPDDCGGVGGYDHLQQIIKDPKHRDHKEMCEWLGIDAEEFDPTSFDLSEIYFENSEDRLKEWEEGFRI